jgi:hypothetical protein
MARARTGLTIAQGCRGAWLGYLFALVAIDIACAQPAGSVTAFQKYRYELELGTKAKVCRHMRRVYNEAFQTPWSYDTYGYPPPWFPPLNADQNQPEVRFGLSSRFPESQEFSAIDWKESVMLGSGGGKTRSVLIAKFDIDNDGQEELVLKNPFMDPWRQGAEDSLLVLDPGQVDTSKPVDPNDIYSRPEGLRRPALINYMTLGFTGAWIRPFVFEKTIYLSVHQGWPRQVMWVLKYKSGGGKIGRAAPGVQESRNRELARPWEPLELDKVCRFRMISE